MELESVAKYLKLQSFPNHTEVAYNGAPCMAIVESSEGYYWKVVPLFARMVYGAETYSDIPYCMEAFGDMEEAIADCVSKLHELGAFIEYDIDSLADQQGEMVVEECRDLALMYGKDLMEAHSLYQGMMNEAFDHPNHAKLDKNKNGKLDKEDFKILRGEKKAVAEEVEEQLEEAIVDSSGKEIKAGHTIHYKEHGDLKVGKVEKDPKYNSGLKVGGRSLANIRDEADNLKIVESEEQLDEVENAFTSVFGPKKTSSSYDLPGHAIISVKSGPDGETHVKRVSQEGHVTTTKYGASGNALGKIKHDDEDPKPHFKAAGIQMASKPKLARGRPPASGVGAGASHEVVKAKVEKGEELTRYEKHLAQKHGLMAKGKAGRKGKELDDAGSEKLFKTLALRSLKKAEKMKTEDVEQLEEGWVKIHPSSQEKDNKARVGKAVKIKTTGEEGTIERERKVPTFSRMVPFAHHITIKLKDGNSVTHPAKNVKVMTEEVEQIEETGSGE